MERIGIAVEVDSGRAINALKEIKGLMDDINKAKVDVGIKLDFGKAEKELKGLISLVQELVNIGHRIELEVRVNGNAADRDMEKVKSSLENLEKAGSKVEIKPTINIRPINEAKSAINETEKAASSLKDTLAGIGAGFSSIGSLFSSVGGAFNSIGGIFNTNVIDTIERMLAAQGTKLVEQGLAGAASRFDILNTFDSYLEVMGVDGNAAGDALDKINRNIQGLPIGLDQAAYQTRKYNMYLDDINKATDLAIGLNKALVAGGASEQMRNYSLFEIDRLLAVGKLATARQWNSLLQGLGVSTKILKEEMGYASLTTSQFVEQLTAGDISTEEFLEGIENLADSDALNELLDIFRTTIESGVSNLKFAMTRGFANLLTAVDETLKSSTGKNISETMLAIRDEINGIFKSADNFIRENPQMLTDAIDIFKEAYDRLKEIDWKSLSTSVLRGVGKYFELLFGIFDNISPEALEAFVTFATVWASPLGRAFSMIGRFFFLLGRAFSFMSRIPGLSKIAGLFGKLTGATSAVGKTVTAMGALKGIGVRFVGATALVGIAAEIGGLIYEYSRIINYINGMPDIGPGFDEKLKVVRNMAGAIGGIAAVLTIASNGFNLTRGLFNTAGFAGVMAIIGLVVGEYADVIQDIGNLNLPSNFDKNFDAVMTLLDKLGKRAGIFTAIASLATALTGGAGAVAIGIGEGLTAGFIGTLDLAIGAVKRVVGVIKEMSEIEPENLDTKVQTTFDQISAVIDYFQNLKIPASAGEAADNAEQVLSAFGNIKTQLYKLQGIDEIDIDVPAVTKRLGEAIDMAKEIQIALGKPFGDEEQFTLSSKDTKMYSQIATNVATTVRQMGDVATTLRQLQLDTYDLGILSDDQGNLLKTSAFSKFSNRLAIIMDTLQNSIYQPLNDMTGKMAWDDKTKSSKFPDIVKNIGDTLTNLSTVVGTMSDMEDLLAGSELGMTMKDGEILSDSKWGRFTTRLDAVVEYIGSIYDKLVEQFPEAEYPDESDMFGSNTAQKANLIVAGFHFMFDNLKLAFEQLLGLETFMDENAGSGGFNVRALAIKSQVNDAVTSIGSIVDTVAEKFSKHESAKVAADNAQQMADSLKTLFDNLKDVVTNLHWFGTDGIEGAATEVTNAITPIGKIIDAVDKINGLGTGSTVTATERNASAQKANISAIVQKAQDMSDVIEEVMGVVRSLNRNYATIGNINENDTAGLLKTIMDKVKEIFVSFPDDPKTVLENAQNIKSAMDEIFGIVTYLSDNMESIGELADNETAGDIGSMIEDMIGALTGDFDIEGITLLASQLNEIISGIQTSLDTLSSVNFETLLGGLDTLGGALDNLTTGPLQSLTDGFDSAKTACDNLASAIDACVAMAIGKAAGFNSFITSLEKVAGTASMAAAMVGSLASAIAMLQDKEITITTHYVTTHSVQGSPSPHSSLRDRGSATGGYVYRAGGGFPRGTDVVRAWLTPGEFVMRRAAVQKFGAGFMARLNQLNLDGALQLLYSARRLPQAVSSVINNSRTYDNHATVNQNIYTNNQRFSHRRAYRYLRTV